MYSDRHAEAIWILAIAVLKVSLPLFLYPSDVDEAVRVFRVFDEHERGKVVQLDRQLDQARTNRVKKDTYVPISRYGDHPRHFPSLQRFHPRFGFLAVVDRFPGIPDAQPVGLTVVMLE